MLIRDKQFPSKKRIGIEWIMNWNCIPPNLLDDRVMNSQKNIWIFEFMKENRRENECVVCKEYIIKGETNTF